MSFTEPKAKKNSKKAHQPLPIVPNHRFKATFNGFSVCIDDKNDMKTIISMGCFGKATLSRTYPDFHNNKIIRQRVYNNRKRHCAEKIQKIVVVPDSDSENEPDEYFKNLKPSFQFDKSDICENVLLSLEEAFFLAFAINCLDITYEQKMLDGCSAWKLFKSSDGFFTTNYIVYHYFRSKNWVVKPGIKFGGDYLLYKQGPQFFHASYVVIINVVDEESRAINFFRRRCMKNTFLMGLNRLCETSGKELLICEITWPSSLPYEEINLDDLSLISVQEILMKRWVPSQERQ